MALSDRAEGGSIYVTRGLDLTSPPRPPSTSCSSRSTWPPGAVRHRRRARGHEVRAQSEVRRDRRGAPSPVEKVLRNRSIVVTEKALSVWTEHDHDRSRKDRHQAVHLREELRSDRPPQVHLRGAPQGAQDHDRPGGRAALQRQTLGVATSHVPAKPKRRGWASGHTTAWKKAVVQLSPTDKIELFEGR